MNELALFAGAGGGIYGSILLGHTTVCAVEIHPKNIDLLLRRQTDGTFPRFPVWDDVRTFDGRPWRGRVDIVSGGFPCQDISCAGSGKGLDGDRSWLWYEMARVIGEVRPKYALIENSPMLAIRGLNRVLADLAAMGFDAEWGVFSACALGAPHTRERMFVLAHARGDGCEAWEGLASASVTQRQSCDRQTQRQPVRGDAARHPWWPARPGVCRVADGVAGGQHRIFALGNGQVPAVAATAWRTLKGMSER